MAAQRLFLAPMCHEGFIAIIARRAENTEIITMITKIIAQEDDGPGDPQEGAGAL